MDVDIRPGRTLKKIDERLTGQQHVNALEEILLPSYCSKDPPAPDSIRLMQNKFHPHKQGSEGLAPGIT